EAGATSSSRVRTRFSRFIINSVRGGWKSTSCVAAGVARAGRTSGFGGLSVPYVGQRSWASTSSVSTSPDTASRSWSPGRTRCAGDSALLQQPPVSAADRDRVLLLVLVRRLESVAR